MNWRIGRFGNRAALLSLVIVAASSVLLSGCVASDGPPKAQLRPLGVVRVSSPVTATTDSGQVLQQAGVYYSTNRNAVVSVVGTSATVGGQISLVETLGVEKMTIPTSGTVTPNQTGTLAADLPGLKPNTTYYYRFYTAGLVDFTPPFPPNTPVPVPVAYALKLGSFKTASAGSVGTPLAPSRMRPGQTDLVVGSLKPRHPAGSSPVRIYRWRRAADGKSWEAKGYVWAKALNYSNYSLYYKPMSFTKGTWRLRALHPAQGNHASIWSPGFEYVSVR